MTPPLVIPPYLKEAPLTGLIGMGGGATSRRVYTASGDDAYQIEKSLRFNSADSPVLVNNLAHSGNRNVWTWSAWVKRNVLGVNQAIFTGGEGSDGNDREGLLFLSDDTLTAYWRSGGTTQEQLTTTQVFRDTGSWMHIVWAFDYNNTQTTASDKSKVWINGRLIYDWDTTFTAGVVRKINETGQGFWLGKTPAGDPSNLQFAEVQFIDGFALSPAAFGQFSSIGVWDPKTHALPVYNANTTWSSGLSHTVAGSAGTWHSPAAKAFNSHISSGSDQYQAVTQLASGNQEIILTWVPPISVENVETLRVSQYSCNSNYIEVRMNSTGPWVRQDVLPGWVSGTDGTWIDFSELIPSDKTITKIEWKRPTTTTGDGINLGVIEVNGVALVDGTTDIETRNNVNDGSTWSDMITVDSGSVNNPSNAFDGLTAATYSNSSATDPIMTFTPTGGLAYTNSVRVWVRTDDHRCRINGGSWVTPPAGTPADGDWCNLASGSSGTITTIDVQYTASSSTAINAIEVDGQILIDQTIDNSFHLKFNDVARDANLGKDILTGKIADATGGLPIYETSGGYGDTKGSGTRTDSLSGNLKLAILGDDVGSTTMDVSSADHDVTVDGVTVSTAQSRFYGSSLLFESSKTERLTVEHADMAFGTGDFCVEFWVYNKTNKDYNAWISTRETSNSTEAGFVIASNASGILYVHSNAALAGSYSSEHVLPLNTWTHVAYTRSGGTHRLFMNGVAAYTANTTSRDFTEDKLCIGDNGYAQDEPVNGYMQDIRVYKGAAKYTSNFKSPKRNDFTPSNLTAAKASYELSLVGSGSGVTLNNPERGYNGFINSYTDADGDVTGSYAMARVEGNWPNDNTITITPSPAITTSSNSNNFTVYMSVHNATDENYSFVVNYSDGTSYSSGTQSSGATYIVRHDVSTGGKTITSIVGTGPAINFGGIRLEDGTNTFPLASSVDSLVDSPTSYGNDGQAGGEVRGNYCTFNPLDTKVASFLTQGNLSFINSGSSWRGVRGSYAIPDGQWYWEFTQKNADGCSYGIGSAKTNLLDHFGGGSGTQEAYTWGGANYYVNGSGSATGLAAPADGDVIGVAYDRTNGKIHFSRNGQWYGASWATKTISEVAAGTDPVTSSISTTMEYFIGHSNYGSGNGCILNTGQLPFVHSAPSGFNCLVSQNLSDIFGANENALEDKNNPSKYFNAIKYKGTDSSSRDIGRVGFQPDLVWIKNRDQTDWHMIQDAVRGANKVLYSHETAGEYTDNENGHVNSFTADGFNVDAGAAGNVNELNENYVAWCWDAGTSTNSSANTDGTDITVAIGNQMVNQTAGFSITKFTGSGSGAANSDSGDSVGHGLSAAPDYIIIKKLTSANGWPIWHSSFNSLEIAAFQSSNSVDPSNYCIPSPPSATAVSLGNNPEINDNADDFIMYAWNATPGFSAFGQYTGNAGVGGPFCYTGFRPKYVLLKGQSFAGNWNVFDTARNPANPANGRLFPNSSAAQANDSSSGNRVNMLANGFEIAGSNADTNNNTSTFVYAAFAEFPFKVSRAA